MVGIISVIGATGNVGRIVMDQLLTSKIVTAEQIKVLASGRSAGQYLEIAGHRFLVQETSAEALQGSDICIFNTEGDISSHFVPIALEQGAYVVDSSSHYRLDPQVPLIVPAVNTWAVNQEQRLYAHSNCLVSPIATVVAPIHNAIGIKRMEVVTYQSTSGAGKGAMDECWYETSHITQGKPYQRQHFARQIAFNVIPQVGNIRDDGFTSEEYKIIHETRKVVGDINITATAVRVPVLRGHCIALSLDLESAASVSEIKAILQSATNVVLSDHDYSTPIEVVGSDDIFVGRIRVNPAIENGIQLWLCSDNLRSGAATDAVGIAAAIAHVAGL